MRIPKDKRKRRRKERLKEKICKYPGCNKIYFGIGRSCYCPNHRSRQARQVMLAQTSKNKTIPLANMTIMHENSYAVQLIRSCDCCNSEYEITLFPGIYIYPKYCELHRNLYKRRLYEQQHAINIVR